MLPAQPAATAPGAAESAPAGAAPDVEPAPAEDVVAQAEATDPADQATVFDAVEAVLRDSGLAGLVVMDFSCMLLEQEEEVQRLHFTSLRHAYCAWRLGTEIRV